jgi:hypothetical protein
MVRGARLALALAGLAAAMVVAAPAGAHAAHKAKPAWHWHRGVAYIFRGTLASDATASSVTLNVTGGNRPALRALLGHTGTVTFATNGATKYIVWTANSGGTNDIPALGSYTNLKSGDRVQVTVRGFRGESLAAITSTPAKRVGDWANAIRPPGVLYLFAGKVTAVDTANGKITIDVRRGNHRALRLLLGQSTSQTFTFGTDTVFLHWDALGPHLISPQVVKIGDPLTIRVRTAPKSDLTSVEATAAWRVNDHEPTASVMADQNS